MISPIKDLVSLIERITGRKDRAAIRSELKDESAVDIAEAITRVDADEAAEVLEALPIFQAAEIMVEAPTETVKQIVPLLSDETLAAYLDVLPMDDAIDLSEELGTERFEALLEVIPNEDAEEIRRLMAYDEDAVGRVMTEHFFRVAPEATMGQVLEDMRLAPQDKYETIHDLFVLSDENKLLGVLSLRRALRLGPDQTAASVMNTEVVTALDTEDQEVAARRMARYGFFALPVVTKFGEMVGVFTGDDAQDILREAETEDVLAIGAVSGDAEPYMSLNVWQLYKRRFPWLLALFAAEYLTGSVMRHYGQNDPSLGIQPLMMFIPLIIGAGGNSGSQVTTTITRALALDEIRGRDTLNVLAKELLVALMIGASLGLVGFLRALAPTPIGWSSGWELSAVVGFALPSIVLWAATVASVLPIAAKKLGIDPAVMSAPFITTFVDATGLIIYFQIALSILNP